MKYTIDNIEGRAKASTFETVHGVIKTPVFMNVGTVAAIKGAVSSVDLHDVGTQVELCNTYHLHVRPGDEIVRRMAASESLCAGTDLCLLTQEDFRSFPWPASERSKRRGYTSIHILTAERFSWVRNRACRYSQIWEAQ